MAVYEIARIQLRRGRISNGVGVPQLASGEMAWAIDSQELFIGNGAVAEGAPSVGNTRILTEKDLNQWGFLGESAVNIEVFPWEANFPYSKGDIVSNNITTIDNKTHIYTFLCILDHTSSSDFLTDYTEDPTTTKWIRTPYLHTYRKDGVVTGLSENEPVIRSINDRLSDRVSLNDFITINDKDSNDYSVALQRAITQLFNNQEYNLKAFNNPNYRITLEIPAGTFEIKNTISIPSYASIIGAGSEKTIINYTGTNPGPAIKFNYDSTIDNLGLVYSTQARHILLKGFTVVTNNIISEAIRLDSVRDSNFIDLNINGLWDGEENLDNYGLLLTAESDLVTCENNQFEQIKISNFYHGINSLYNIKNNTFKRCEFKNNHYGFVLGINEESLPINQNIGSTNNIIDNCTFTGISRQAVYIGLGTGNTISDCTLINVGNDSNGELEPFTGPKCPQIYFDSAGNISQNNRSARTDWLSFVDNIQPFVPETCGKAVTYTRYGNWSRELDANNEASLAIRLPLRTDKDGNPEKISNYIINYNYNSYFTPGYIRRGVLNISANFSELTTPIQLVDEFDYAGLEDDEAALTLRFSVEFASNNDQVCGINLFYLNSLAEEQGDLTYTYTVIY